MITDKIDGISDNELIERVHKSIIDEYGIAGYIRYIRLLQPNNDGQDYLKVRDKLNKTATIDRICEQAAQYNNENK
jgi:hypothetical protein